MRAMDTRAHLSIVACLPRPRPYIARWRDDETGTWKVVKVISYNASDVVELVESLTNTYSELRVQPQ